MPATTLAMPAADCTRDSATEISRAELERDLATLATILNGAYAPLRAHPELGGVASVLSAVRAGLGARETIPIVELQKSLAAALGQFPDGHLGITRIVDRKSHGSEALANRYLAAYTGDVRLERRDGHWRVATANVHDWVGAELSSCVDHPLHDLIQTTVVASPSRPQHLMIVRSAKPPVPLRCRILNTDGASSEIVVPLRPLAMPPNFDRGDRRLPALELHDSDIPVVRIRDFVRKESAKLPELATQLRDKRAIVFDLRGNPGGSEDPGIAFAQALTSDSFFGVAGFSVRSPARVDGQRNVVTCDAHGKPLAADDEKLLSDEAAKLAAQTIVPAWEYSPPDSYVGTAQRPFAGRLLVLTDNNCASACEGFVRVLRQLGAVIVGNHTMGANEYANVGLFRLPASGLLLDLTPDWFVAPKPGLLAQDLRGFSPDFWIDDENSPAIASDIARCLVDEACGNALLASLRW